MLKEEYARTVSRVKAMLAQRPGTHLLVIQHSDAISNPLSTAGKLNAFLGGGLDVAKMAAAIDAGLHRRGAATRGGEPASDGSLRSRNRPKVRLPARVAAPHVCLSNNSDEEAPESAAKDRTP